VVAYTYNPSFMGRDSRIVLQGQIRPVNKISQTPSQKKKKSSGQVLRLMPIIPATQEAETGRIKVQGQPRQKISETNSWV
jgi:hypothetical protein